MPLSDTDKEQCRHHLGYPQMTSAASIQFGVPRPMQSAFLLEQAMNLLLEAAVPRCRRILSIMQGIEDKLVDAQDRLLARKIAELELLESEPQRLEQEYVRWGYRLADLLGVPIYPYSMKYRSGVGGVGGVAGSIPVR